MMNRLMIAVLLVALFMPVPARANGFTHMLKKVAHVTENTLLIVAVVAGVVVVCSSGGCR